MTNAFRLSLLVVLVLGLSVGLSGCDSTGADEDGNEAPPPPPTEMFATSDFDSFPSAGKSPKLNAINAGLRLGIVSGVVFSVQAFPAALTAAVTSSEPTYVSDDGLWRWEADTTYQSTSVELTLEGRLVGDATEWDMYASVSSPDFDLDNFQVYTATVAADRSGASWTINAYVDASDTPFLSGIYERFGETGRSLVFTALEGAQEASGDEVRYEVEAETRTFRWEDVSSDHVHLIGWEADGGGYIEATNYNDGERACWDAQYEDVACE